MGKRRARTAARSRILDESFARIDLNGNSTITELLISKTVDKVLIGVITFEALGLSVDPTKGTLRETETLLLTEV